MYLIEEVKKQIEGVNLICADRNNLKDILKPYNFDAVIDVCGYKEKDIKNLINGLNKLNKK